MRRMILEALAALMLASCAAIDPFEPTDTLGTGMSRNETLVSRSGRKEHGVPPGGTEPGFRKDTALYVSALEFPDGYDWRRDSAYIRSGAAIVLFRNGERVLELPTGTAEGIGTGADMHHIVQGHIVTEYYGSTGTTVRIDGKEVFHSSQFEVLKGLLMDGDRLLSLSQKRKGFVYRKDGTVVMERSSGDLIGSLGEDLQFQGGALSSDGGHILFAYRSADGPVLVEDGMEKPVACNGELVDVRVVEGEPCILERDGDILRFSVGDRSRSIGNNYSTARRGCHISIVGGMPVALCFFDSRFGSATTEMHLVDRTLRILMGIHTVVPCGDGYGYITHDPSAWLNITDPDGNATRHDGRYLWMGTQACCSLGGGITVAATPYSEDAVPEIIRDGEKEKMDINGFVTAVSCVVNHPS